MDLALIVFVLLVITKGGVCTFTFWNPEHSVPKQIQPLPSSNSDAVVPTASQDSTATDYHVGTFTFHLPKTMNIWINQPAMTDDDNDIVDLECVIGVRTAVPTAKFHWGRSKLGSSNSTMELLQPSETLQMGESLEGTAVGLAHSPAYALRLLVSVRHLQPSDFTYGYTCGAQLNMSTPVAWAPRLFLLHSAAPSSSTKAAAAVPQPTAVSNQIGNAAVTRFLNPVSAQDRRNDNDDANQNMLKMILFISIPTLIVCVAAIYTIVWYRRGKQAGTDTKSIEQVNSAWQLDSHNAWLGSVVSVARPCHSQSRLTADIEAAYAPLVPRKHATTGPVPSPINSTAPLGLSATLPLNGLLLSSMPLWSEESPIRRENILKLDTGSARQDRRGTIGGGDPQHLQRPQSCSWSSSPLWTSPGPTAECSQGTQAEALQGSSHSRHRHGDGNTTDYVACAKSESTPSADAKSESTPSADDVTVKSESTPSADAKSESTPSADGVAVAVAVDLVKHRDMAKAFINALDDHQAAHEGTHTMPHLLSHADDQTKGKIKEEDAVVECSKGITEPKDENDDPTFLQIEQSGVSDRRLPLLSDITNRVPSTAVPDVHRRVLACKGTISEANMPALHASVSYEPFLLKMKNAPSPDTENTVPGATASTSTLQALREECISAKIVEQPPSSSAHRTAKDHYTRDSVLPHIQIPCGTDDSLIYEEACDDDP